MVKLLVKENQDKKFTVKGIVFIILFFYCKIPQKDKLLTEALQNNYQKVAYKIDKWVKLY